MEFGWINIFGIAIVAIILIPNIFYAIKFKNIENNYTGKAMTIIEQIGRYACMLLMILPLGVWSFGYSSKVAMLIYMIGNIILLVAYWGIWVLYYKTQTVGKAIVLAVIPTCIFLISGTTLQHWLLVVASILFGVGHIYITYQNNQ